MHVKIILCDKFCGLGKPRNFLMTKIFQITVFDIGTVYTILINQNISKTSIANDKCSTFHALLALNSPVSVD